MTFVHAFYSFNLEITNSDSGAYHKLRVKIPRHPAETLEQMFARVLAFGHSYEAGLEFSRGLFEVREPSLWKRDVLGELELAIEVGEVDQEKLRRTLRRAPDARYRVYFFDAAQMANFCRAMRGSTTNWIKDIGFFALPPPLLEALLPHEQSSSSWGLTFVDDTLYLSVDGAIIESAIEPLDMWGKFQESLACENA